MSRHSDAVKQDIRKSLFGVATRGEALRKCIAEAEDLMRQIRNAQDSAEKANLRAKAFAYLDQAEELKTATDESWAERKSTVQPSEGDSELLPAPGGSEDSASTNVIPEDSSTVATSIRPDDSVVEYGIPNQSDQDALPSIGDLSFTSKMEPQPTKEKAPGSAAPNSTETVSIGLSSTGPISTRLLSKREEIIILRASQFNGYKFRPWKGMPGPQAFQGTEFVDTPSVHLSKRLLKAIRGWGRPSLALPPPTWPTYHRDVKGPIDLVQHAATDCSVVASLCAIVGRSQRGFPPLFKSRIFPGDPTAPNYVPSPNHKYVVKLNINGCEREVVIDDLLPISKTSNLIHVVDRNNPSLLWPALIEKAYLKTRGGYDFPGSNSATDLWILIGWVPEMMFLQSNEIDADALWKKLHSSFHYGDLLITLGTGELSEAVVKEYGLAEIHDYPVLNMKEENGQKILTVKNPWSSGGIWRSSGEAVPPTATAPEEEPLVDQEALSSPDLLTGVQDLPVVDSTQQEELTSGTFHIKFEEMLQHFNTIYLNWNPALWMHRQDIHFEWNLADKKSTGFANHPQFQVSVEEKDQVFLVLTKHFNDVKRPSRKGPAGYLSLYAFEADGQKVYTQDGFCDQAMYVDSPHTLLRTEFEARKMYTIVPGEMDLSPEMHTFTLSVFSTPPVTLEPALSPYTYSTLIKSEWTQDTAGGNISSSRYYENPQFAMKVTHPTKLCLCLQTGVDGLNIHVKLTHGHGKRLNKIKRRDIIVDSEDYRARSAIAQCDLLDEGTYTIICSTFAENQLGPFSLRADADCPIELSHIPSPHAGRIRTKFADCALTYNRDTLACPLYPHRLSKMYVVLQFRKGFSYGPDGQQSLGRQAGSRSPIRLSVEIGTGPDRRFIVTSGNGEYSDDERGIVTEEFDLGPQHRGLGDVWLVLERLSRPGNLEEHFAVEVYTDVPNAFSVGPWRAHGEK